MKLVYTIFLGCFLSGCYAQKRTITFINQSEITIDSIRVAVASADVYTVKHTNIDIGDTVYTVIPSNKPKSNKHDVMIDISIYIKNRDVIYKYSYNDLRGYLDGDYIIVLNKEMEVEWRYFTAAGFIESFELPLSYLRQVYLQPAA